VTRSAAEEVAALWLLKREEPRWGAEDQAALDAWLDADPEHEAALWRLEYGAQKLERLPALRGAAIGEDAPARHMAVSRRWWLPAGAGLAAAIAGAAILLPNTGLLGPKTYATEIGGREELPLADGTKVELNTATRLRAEVTRTSRNVWLDHGEAYFEVAHDPRHPFVVHAGPKTITVLGTKFSVRRDGDRIQVAVLEGRVRVDNVSAAPTAQAAVITKGDIAVADAASTLVSPRSAEKVDDALSWRDGRLKFHETALADVAAEFNRYNRVRLVIADPQAAGTRIGGNFEAENVRDFAGLLERAYGFRVEAKGDTLKVFSPS
jgi:transmembrane sensor